MKKHAYLIMAHYNMKELERLMRCLDYELNDLYLHIDIKAENVNVEYLSRLVKKSKLVFLYRKNIIWGSESQIECEMELIKCALHGGEYSYLHLLSESDLPIKPQSIIHQFFDQNAGKEFIHFETVHLSGADRNKIYRFYPFQKYIGNKKNMLYYLQNILVKIQIFTGIHRKIQIDKFAKGSNWFSITSDFANYIVQQEDWIKRTFRYTLCCDEIFIQTLVLQSNYKDRLYKATFDDDYTANMRKIFWRRGKSSPRYIKNEDIQVLIESKRIFARKFDLSFSDEMLTKLLDNMK